MLLALLACTGNQPEKTSILVTITGPDLAAVAEQAEDLVLIGDPDTPFVDGDGYAVEGDFGSFVFMDALTDDEDLELTHTRAFSAELPTIELTAGANRPNLTFTAWAQTEGVGIVAMSDTSESVTFVEDGVVEVTVTGLELLDVPLSGCTDELDNDSDGWTDADDADCADGGIEEDGFGSTECNDGDDNDGDGGTDADDADCESASDEAEANGCQDEIDNDDDGWIDAEDWECLEGTDEEGETSDEWDCSNGLDDDGDGDADFDDEDCDDAFDDEEPEPCENGLDDDSDGWTDADDPDCDTEGDEVGYGSWVCNDGFDNDEDGLTDSEDPSCTNAFDMTELDECEDEIDNDSDLWTDLDDLGCDGDEHGESEGAGFEDEAECSDGDDNDGDGLVDGLDPDCNSAKDDAEAADCEDGNDNDGDGWADADDPDCDSDGAEIGFSDLACNDHVDNDGDGDTDASDDDCESATDDDDTVDCDDGLDNDSDGWYDAEDPDCSSGTEESGFGSTDCGTCAAHLVMLPETLEVTDRIDAITAASGASSAVVWHRPPVLCILPRPGNPPQ